VTLRAVLSAYIKATPPFVLAIDGARVLAILLSPFLAELVLRAVANNNLLLAPIHVRLFANPAYRHAGLLYRGIIAFALALNAAWCLRALKNFVRITAARVRPNTPQPQSDLVPLPPWPYTRESFAVILGELQNRDGSRVPSPLCPDLKPRWLILPELSLYTGVFVTGGIGSGKTAAVAYPALRQLLGFRRFVNVRRKDGTVTHHNWAFSGLILDEKGDFTRAAAQYCQDWGRQDDLIRIVPGGKWIWNVIYNPNLPTWAVAYQLGWILKNFNKGASGGDPFWENAPKELVTDYLCLLDDAQGYYTLFDYLETLVDDSRQDQLHEMAMRRFSADPVKTQEIERRRRSIMKRRDDMSVNLRGALEACARAGIDMFRFPELRRTFCPTREEYFELDPSGNVQRPRANVFTGFDQILEYGRIVGLEMPKQVYFDAAVFCQVALKAQWQDAVLRRETIGSDGQLLQPPRFGERIGYCPTFLMADEAQQNATPKDAEFKAVCRSKRASMWELTQSHGSVKGAFGPSNAAHAMTYFQNSMTHVYLRQSDPDSIKIIQQECGNRIVHKTSLAVTEGGSASELSYVEGDLVHQGLGMSSTKTVATEEKPFVEVDELKQLPNNVALVLPSNGNQTLPATVTYLRPLWIQKKYPHLPVTTPWLDWPAELRGTYDLDTIPQELHWQGWGSDEPLAEEDVLGPDARLGKFVQPAIHATASPSAPPVPSAPTSDEVVLPPTRTAPPVTPPPVLPPPEPEPVPAAPCPLPPASSSTQSSALPFEDDDNPFASLPEDG
jgi:hypothetical protein